MVTSALLSNQRAGRHSISTVTSGVGRVARSYFHRHFELARAFLISLASYFLHEMSVK